MSIKQNYHSKVSQREIKGRGKALLSCKQYSTVSPKIGLYFTFLEVAVLPLELYLYSDLCFSNTSRRFFHAVHLWPSNSNVSTANNGFSAPSSILDCQSLGLKWSDNKKWSPARKETYCARRYSTGRPYRYRVEGPQCRPYDFEHAFIGAWKADFVSSL
jgi:hypothetical protein